MTVCRSALADRFVWSASFLLAACATRELPARYPSTSAAAPEAAMAAPADVTRSLRDEPGSQAEGSAAGEAAPATASPHDSHGGHHHAH